MKDTAKQSINFQDLNFQSSDTVLFNKVIKLENQLAHSSSIAHHLKDPSIATGEKVSFNQVMIEEAQIISSMSNVENMFKAYAAIIEFRENLYLPESMILHFGIIELSRVGCQSTNLITINIAVTYLEKCLAINSKLMNLEEGTKVGNLLVVMALNNLGALHSKIGNDVLLTTEYYKQAWVIGRKISLEKDNTLVTSLKVSLDQFIPGFTTEKESSCSYIKTRGEVKEDDHSLVIKAAILPKILSKIPELVQAGKWSSTVFGSDWGVKGYSDSKYINKILKQDTHCTAKDVEKAQMLCFETICAATLSSKNQSGSKCLEEFIKANPGLVSRILFIHPEYCLDGKIVSTCIDTFTKEEFEFDLPEIDYIDITVSGEVTDL